MIVKLHWFGQARKKAGLKFEYETRQSWIRKFVLYIGSFSNVAVVNCKERFQLKKINLS